MLLGNLLSLANNIPYYSPPTKVSLVAADDHPIFLQGLSSLIDLSDTHQLKALANNGDELLNLIGKYKPDIALVDLSMPGTPTTEILTTIRSEYPQTKAIALTMHMEADRTKKLFELGLAGYILKESAFEELFIAIDTVIQGGEHISNGMKTALDDYNKKPNHSETLTQREIQILENAAKGDSNKMIARTLSITERTVRFHLANCCLKLNAQGRSNAVAIALKKSLISY